MLQVFFVDLYSNRSRSRSGLKKHYLNKGVMCRSVGFQTQLMVDKCQEQLEPLLSSKTVRCQIMIWDAAESGIYTKTDESSGCCSLKKKCTEL